MSIKKYGTPGSRLRHLRKNILRISQDEMSRKLGVSRSLVPTMEADKQGVSKATAEKLYEAYGVNMIWLLTGDGEPLSISGTSPPTSDKTYESPTKRSYGMSIEGAGLLVDPAYFRDRTVKGEFGYVSLDGIKLRLHAARDSAILGSHLFQIIEDENLWLAAGEPNGWEYEVLRQYFESGGDRELSGWMECLRLVRWQRGLLLLAAEVKNPDEVQSA